MSDQDLAYHLQMKFGLSYNEPNSYQLLAIKADISRKRPLNPIPIF